MKEYELVVDPISARWGDAVQHVDTKVIEGIPPENQEVVVELRDPRLMGRFKAKVIISSKPDELPGADKLWLTSQGTGRHKEPWAVKIIEMIEEEEREVQALPERRPSLGERKGRLLEELLKERERKLSEKKGAQ